MSKKILAAFLVLALMLPVATALAFSFSEAFEAGSSSDSGGNTPPPTPIPAPAEFVYRDGIKFGMSVDEVKSCEKNKPASEGWNGAYSNPRRYVVEYQGEKTLDYSCNIQYLFDDTSKSLVQITVNLYMSFHRDYDYSKLQNEFVDIDYELTRKYGPPDGETVPDVFAYTGAMNQHTDWTSNRERSFSIQHSLRAGNAQVMHSIHYYCAAGDPGPI